MSLLALAVSLPLAATAHAAPETRVAVDGFQLSISDTATQVPFELEVSGFDADGDEAKARASFGNLGVSAEGLTMATASFQDVLTGIAPNGAPTGIFQLQFRLDGSIDSGGLLEVGVSTSVDPSDAFIPNDPDDPQNDDLRSSKFFQFDPAIATSFADLPSQDAPNVTEDQVTFRTSDEMSVNFALSGIDDQPTTEVDTLLIIELAAEVMTPFTFFFELAAFGPGGAGSIDFFGSAVLEEIRFVDPVTSQVFTDGFSLNGQSGVDYVALVNQPSNPVPVPAAFWLMAAGAAAITQRQRRSKSAG
ncbi:MAG: hypothetical protein AAF830_06450 [Pseudomonadota bacterium]